MFKKTELLYVILIVIGISSVAFNSQTVFGEVLYGNNTDTSIIIDFRGDSNKTVYKSIHGTSTHYDSEIKQYEHGGFFLKNPEIVVWGHPLGNGEYTLVVMTSMGFERFTVISDDFFDISIVSTSKEIEPEKIPEPEILVESERDRILREYYESKVDSARPADAEKVEELLVDFRQYSMLDLWEEYNPNIQVYNAHDVHYNVEGFVTTLEITRDGKIIDSATGVTNSLGKWSPVTDIRPPTYYPGFCYEVQITIESNLGVLTVNDDFIVSGTYTDTDDHYFVANDYRCNSED